MSKYNERNLNPGQWVSYYAADSLMEFPIRVVLSTQVVLLNGHMPSFTVISNTRAAKEGETCSYSLKYAHHTVKREFTYTDNLWNLKEVQTQL